MGGVSSLGPLQRWVRLRAQAEDIERQMNDLQTEYFIDRASLYRSGALTASDLLSAYDSMQFGPFGKKDRWEVATSGLDMARVKAEAKIAEIESLGTARSTWAGHRYLLPGEKYPPYGVSVVYYLRTDGNILYIGSSGSFRHRIVTHRGDKDFDTWNAVACPDRASAFKFEASEIRKHRPPLNKVGY